MVQPEVDDNQDLGQDGVSKEKDMPPKMGYGKKAMKEHHKGSMMGKQDSSKKRTKATKRGGSKHNSGGRMKY